MTTEKPRRIKWIRDVYRWRGRKYVIARCITIPLPKGSAPLVITNKEQMVALYGHPTGPTAMLASDILDSATREYPPLTVTRNPLDMK